MKAITGVGQQVVVALVVVAVGCCAVWAAQQQVERVAGGRRAHSRQFRPKSAQDNSRHALDLAGRAEAALNRGDVAEAEKLANESLRINPHSTIATYVLGRVYDAQNRGADALAAYRYVVLRPEGGHSTLETVPQVLERYAALASKYGMPEEASAARARLKQAQATHERDLTAGKFGGAGLGYETERDREDIKRAIAARNAKAAQERQGKPATGQPKQTEQ